MKFLVKTIPILLVLLLALSSLLACSSNGENSTPSPSRESLWTGDSIVKTSYGSVKGFPDESDTWVWKAIPFAKPPVGDLRWKAPRDPNPWEGVMEKTEFCSPCVQYNALGGNSMLGSEDCLYLNVWRPQTKETDLPVYVWIHGGGNSTGSATYIPTYYGTNLAHKSNMVFVSINYRIGPFGWFTHPALRSGDPDDDSGNYGTLDLIQALEWIRDNIASFGGDPERVTITGESAGAMNVLSLIISPRARGLFHGALVQSGQAVSIPVADGEASAREVIFKLSMNDGSAADRDAAEFWLEDTSIADIGLYLRAKTAEEIFACYESMGFGMILFPFIFEDGTVIAEAGFDSLANGTYPNKVPIIIGSNKEEIKIFMFMDPSFSGKDELYQTVATYGSDFWKADGVDDVARKLRAHKDQPDVYVYQFNWGSSEAGKKSPIPAPWDLKLGACHSLDVPFFLGSDVFNGPMTDWVFTEENRAGREALSDAMMTYVAQFARTGDPNAQKSELPEWKPWDNSTDKPKCIIFDANGDVPDIKMSPVEFTVPGVLANMQANVPEPLYSEAFDFLLSMPTVSHLLVNSD